MLTFYSSVESDRMHLIL